MDSMAEKVVNIVKEKIPECEVDGIILYKGKYIASISMHDDDPFLALANFHEVNLETGEVSSALPTLSLTLDPEFNEALSKTRPLKKRRFFRALWHKRTKMGRQKWSSVSNI